MASDLLLTRDEVLGGLPARRAAALLFLIESRTAHLVDRARHAMDRFRTEEADRERELAYVEAFALGREPPLKPTIQDLERFAPQWADLVPENPRLRAAVAHTLGQKHQFTARDVPRLRTALGLDLDAVRDAHQRLYKTPLESIYAEAPSLATRLRWARASMGTRLETLPPFWTAFALTLSETVGAGILALPIALATVGPLPAVMLLVLFGLVNVLTVAWMAETTARTAIIRYGGAYFGRMVKEYLGGAGASLLTLALLVNTVVGLLAYAIGVSATLANVTGVIGVIWVLVLFLIAGYLASQHSINASVATALVFGLVNLALIFILAGVGFAHIDADNLAHMELPGIGGSPFDLSVLGLVFGALIVAYFGHTSVGNCAAVVLQRDPTGRALIWGVAAAQAATIAVYAIWILGINGALSPDVLEGQAATALGPLASVAGPSVQVIGTLFVVLSMGSALTHKAEVLLSIMRDWFPRRSHPVVLLPKGQARLAFEPRHGEPGRCPRFVLTYLGLAGDQPRFRIQSQIEGRVYRADWTGAATWSGREACRNVLPAEALEQLDLTVAAITMDDRQVRLLVTTGMRMHFEGSWTTAGLDLASLLDVGGPGSEPDPDAALLRWMLRQGEVSLDAAAAWAGLDHHQMQEWLRTLVRSGAVREMHHDGGVGYRVTVARRRARHVPDGLHLDDTPATPARRTALHDLIRTWTARVSGWLHSDRVRTVLEYSPLVAIVPVAMWLVAHDRATFTGLLSLSGTIAVPVFAGVFPCLLLASSRRKGDLVPALVSRFLGHPWLIAAVYVFFLVSILLHGILVWQRPAERVLAVVVAIVMLVVSVIAIRQGALERRTVVTLREDRRPGGGTVFEVVSSGQYAAANAELAFSDGVRQVDGSVAFAGDLTRLQHVLARLSPDTPPDIKVWANRVLPEGEIQGLPAQLRLVCGKEQRRLDLGLAGGMALLLREGDPCSLEISLDQPASPAKEPKKARRRKRPADVHALLASTDAGATGAGGG